MIDLAFGSHNAAVSVDDPLDCRKPDTGSFETCRVMKSLKSSE
jgi:hypothetical protein